MSALAGLVDQGLVAPDWAEALAPVDDRIAAMGRFLREELAAGRPYLPAGDRILRAFQRPLADVRVLVVGQDPYPTPGHPIGLSFAVAPDVRPLPGSLRNIYQELRTDLGVEPPAHGDLTAWADRGVMLLNRVLTVRPGEAASHRGRGWEVVTECAITALAAPRRAAGRDPVGPRRAVAQADARPDPLGRVGPPLAAVGLPRLLRLAPLLPGQPAPRRPGRPAGRLVAAGVRPVGMAGVGGGSPCLRGELALHTAGTPCRVASHHVYMVNRQADPRNKVETETIMSDVTDSHACPVHRPRCAAAARRPDVVGAARRLGRRPAAPDGDPDGERPLGVGAHLAERARAWTWSTTSAASRRSTTR